MNCGYRTLVYNGLPISRLEAGTPRRIWLLVLSSFTPPEVTVTTSGNGIQGEQKTFRSLYGTRSSIADRVVQEPFLDVEETQNGLRCRKTARQLQVPSRFPQSEEGVVIGSTIEIKTMNLERFCFEIVDELTTRKDCFAICFLSLML